MAAPPSSSLYTLISSTIRDFLGSKKAIATFTALVVYIGGRFGLQIDPTVLDHVMAALMVYVAAQGVADIGKPAAQVAAAAPSGSRGAVVMFAVLLLGLGSTQLTACGAAQHVGGAVIDCTIQDAPQISALIATLRTAPPAGCHPATGIDWSCAANKALAAGSEIGGCALAQLAQGFLAPPSGTAAPSPDSGQAARAALERVRAQFGGVTWRTSQGDL